MHAVLCHAVYEVLLRVARTSAVVPRYVAVYCHQKEHQDLVQEATIVTNHRSLQQSILLS